MATPNDPFLATHEHRESRPMPPSVPAVDEIGATSAPLTSAAYFIGAHCQAYNEDFMLCKAESTNPAHCLKEGRKVTRCAADVLRQLRANCAEEFERHWKCLNEHNLEFPRCRQEERPLNECAFARLGLKKVIPGTSPATAIHEKKNPIHT
ncbi:NADH dehydrogenase alpha subcomplex subunit 8 [Syncephalis pseudoplumigaleata]|uniref:NADH-ubiquinone oxidoreductase n=1 Tax=Syncephalis pseudoplumigaleata TaxID=1712513 RepID=A0A4P9Z168_9FUNG|nr:NADH dehydrogenase alpha subcomplex subunit 8 [Syncephalis pseudoplumigaleata]|eukprot:RKP26217.1 NADH dehydrogenase alpha subcomplex subunit 8 [Syncephalis pseudoplumigaleata]